MTDDRMEFVTVGLKKRGVSTRLRLRWDRSPRTCREIVNRLPLEGQAWHAKYANNEVYLLVPMFGEDPRAEWRCLYPGPGDLMYIPVESGASVPQGGPDSDTTRGIVDIAYFYERGNNLIGPYGIALGNIFATATSIEELEQMSMACSDVWFNGAAGETLYVEAA